VGTFGEDHLDIYGREIAMGADGSLYVTDLLTDPVEWGVAKYAPAGAPGLGVAKVRKPKRAPHVDRKVRLKVSCTSTVACSGRLVLTVKGKRIAKPAAYAIPAGAKKKVVAKLTAKGRRLIHGRTVIAKATVAGGATKVRLRG
jgi:hypothetical protein